MRPLVTVSEYGVTQTHRHTRIWSRKFSLDTKHMKTILRPNTQCWLIGWLAVGNRNISNTIVQCTKTLQTANIQSSMSNRHYAGTRKHGRLVNNNHHTKGWEKNEKKKITRKKAKKKWNMNEISICLLNVGARITLFHRFMHKLQSRFPRSAKGRGKREKISLFNSIYQNI